MRKLTIVRQSYTPDESVPYVYRRAAPPPTVPAELFAAAVCAGLMVLCVLVAVLAFGG